MRLALLALVALVACGDDASDPITQLTAPRVIAVVTEPSALVLDASISLEAVTVDEQGPRTAVGTGDRSVSAVRMRACSPWRVVADPGRDCPAEAALALVVDAAGRATLDAAALADAFAADGPPGAFAALASTPGGLPVAIIIDVDVDGTTLLVRRDIALVAPDAVRTNPRVAEVRVDGGAPASLVAGQAYELSIVLDGTSLDVLPDGAREQVRAALYSGRGELADHIVEPPDSQVGEVVLTSPTTYTAGAAGTAWLHVVVTDETAGMTSVAVPLVVE